MKARITETRRRIGWLCGVGAWFLLALPAATVSTLQAATFPELYTVSVPPDPLAPNLRADAERRALTVLLTRITGRRDVTLEQGVDSLIRNAGSYVTSYQSAADEIRIGFSRTGINDALTSLNLPIWVAERPATLVWIAADLGGGERTEIMADTANPARRPGAVAGAPDFPLSEEATVLFDALLDELVTTADERGLPIVLPLLDAEDRTHARFADVWGGFDQFVAEAAERYPVDAVLVGRIAATSFGLEVRWTLLRGELRQSRATADVRAGIDWLADEFAAQFTTVGGARLTWLTVRDIETHADFGRVLEYLQSVSFIESTSVVPRSWSEGSLVVSIAARYDDAQLRQYLELGGVLHAADGALGGIPVNAEVAAPLEFVPGWLAAEEPAIGP